MSRRIAELVSPRYRQVFFVPEDWQAAPDCTIWNGAESCAARECDRCATWKKLPLIKKNSFELPDRIQGLDARFQAYVPGYWVIPSRCFLHHYGTIATTIRQTNDAWYKFKTGVKELAYPLALGMYHALRRDGLLLDYDYIVPIPLNPAKKSAREIHRTLLLSQELGQLLGAEVREVLQLDKAISKRVLRTQLGYSAARFEQAYYDALKLKNSTPPGRVLVVDDVGTRGSTLRAAFRRLSEMHTDSEVIACTAGQMILKSVVKKPDSLLA